MTMFSSTVRSSKTRRPSITWKTPRRTTSSGGRRSIRSPSNSIVPSVTSPSSAASSPEMAFRVVDLPAPFEPSNATMLPFGTVRERPFRTRITSS